MLSSDKNSMFVSGEVCLSSGEVSLSSSKVNLSSGKVGSSGSEVILSKILILKSIVCCVCVMFSSDVSWGMNDEEKINAKIQNNMVVWLGDQEVGKTKIVNQKIDNKFDGKYQATIGVDYSYYTTGIPQADPPQNIKLHLWDTAGQETFRTLSLNYCKTADVIVIVYDITNKTSFDNIQEKWLEPARKQATKDAVYFLVGNKTDMEEKRVVSQGEAQALAVEKGMIFLEVSAKTGDNIDELFEAIAKVCAENDIKTPPPSENKRCNCCPCNKDKEDEKEEKEFPESKLDPLIGSTHLN